MVTIKLKFHGLLLDILHDPCKYRQAEIDHGAANLTCIEQSSNETQQT